MLHTPGQVCQGCEAKLSQAHPYMRDWFHRRKILHPEVHISWAYRDKDDQNALYKSGKTKRLWPESTHNRTVAGVPLSDALDLFTIDVNGIGHWEPTFYAQIAAESRAEAATVLWGHDFKTFPEDMDHFERVPANG